MHSGVRRTRAPDYITTDTVPAHRNFMLTVKDTAP